MLSLINKLIDNFLNKVTMYRLVLYLLSTLCFIAITLSGFHLLPFSPIALTASVAFLLLVSKVSNYLFSRVFKAPTNTESVYITALILSLIISPPSLSREGLGVGFIFLFWAALLATTSKYVLNIGHKHLFNPAAVAVVLTAIGFGASASWWIGDSLMALPVAIASYLIIRKIRRWDLVYSFLFTVILTSLGFGLIKGSNLLTILNTLFLHSSLLFFTGIMLTEPLTSPTTKNLQFVFGTLIGILFVPQIHIGSLYFSPEQALVIGNLFAYLAGTKRKLVLTLKEKNQLTSDTYDFVFSTNKKLNYLPGQFMEWTLEHPHPDERGNRRYFTLASSPTEKDLRLGIKISPDGSTFKKTFLSLGKTPIIAGQLGGSFTLPIDQTEKSVFIAGGIGITPFRSMIKYLLDTHQKRNTILLYVNKNPSEIVYRDVFDPAQTQTGLKVIYYNTDTSPHFDKNNFPKLVPDYQQRTFYISGPHGLVGATQQLLLDLGIKSDHIKTDYFPGFA